MKNLLFVATLLTVATLFSCNPKQAAPPAPAPIEAPEMVGNDKDKHGCIGSAGYTWSVVSNSCIRLFETGTRLVSTQKEATAVAFVIFSADKLVCELFVPGSKESFLLDHHTIGKKESWFQMDDHTYELRQEKGRWVCDLNGEKVYEQSVK